MSTTSPFERILVGESPGVPVPYDATSGNHPFRQFLLKVHSRCDLACRYCYVYTKADQRWQSRPARMSVNTIDNAARRIAEHVTAHGLPAVSVVLHGGEPLLAGLRTIAHCATSVRAAVGGRATVHMAIQTNGVRLDAAVLDVLRAHSFRVSVSLDGDRDANDRHRTFRSGRSSFPLVVKALRELRRAENVGLFAGILCTVDLDNDPVQTYESLLRHRPPQIDFLLPEGNWTDRPPGRTDESGHTPYAEWLIRIFDRWYDHPVKETGIRIFDDIISLVLGGSASAVGVSTAPMAAIIVETDGAIEAADALTATFPGAAVTGLTVADNAFDEAWRLPIVQEQQGGVAALAPACRKCPIMSICGGGAHSHRFRRGSGFRNPSVYCPDLLRLITHIRRRVTADVDRLRSAGASP